MISAERSACNDHARTAATWAEARHAALARFRASLGAPWKGSSGELVCRVDQHGQLYLDVALRTEPPAIQSITYLFCSSEEPSRVLERVYQEYGITNGLKEMNPVM